MANAYTPEVFHIKTSCFQNELAAQPAELPADYPHDFAERLRPSDCCAVIRHAYHSLVASRPRRCRSKRQLWSPTRPGEAKECCVAHRKQNAAAKAWMDGRSK